MKISEKLNENGDYILSSRCKDEPNPRYNVSGSRPCLICGELCWITSDLKNNKVDGLVCKYCLTNKDWEKDEIDN